MTRRMAQLTLVPARVRAFPQWMVVRLQAFLRRRAGHQVLVRGHLDYGNSPRNIPRIWWELKEIADA